MADSRRIRVLPLCPGLPLATPGLLPRRGRTGVGGAWSSLGCLAAWLPLVGVGGIFRLAACVACVLINHFAARHCEAQKEARTE